MKLEDWITKHGMTSAGFGKTAGIGNKQLVHKYRRGHRFPTPENLRLIRLATNGEVTADDFVDQHTAKTEAHADVEAA